MNFLLLVLWRLLAPRGCMCSLQSSDVIVRMRARALMFRSCQFLFWHLVNWFWSETCGLGLSVPFAKSRRMSAACPSSFRLSVGFTLVFISENFTAPGGHQTRLVSSLSFTSTLLPYCFNNILKKKKTLF